MKNTNTTLNSDSPVHPGRHWSTAPAWLSARRAPSGVPEHPGTPAGALNHT